jgi:hypothetical protein
MKYACYHIPCACLVPEEECKAVKVLKSLLDFPCSSMVGNFTPQNICLAAFGLSLSIRDRLTMHVCTAVSFSHSSGREVLLFKAVAGSCSVCEL